MSYPAWQCRSEWLRGLLPMRADSVGAHTSEVPKEQAKQVQAGKCQSTLHKQQRSYTKQVQAIIAFTNF